MQEKIKVITIGDYKDSTLKNYFKDFEMTKIKNGRKIEYLEFKFVPEKKYQENIGNEKVILSNESKVEKKIVLEGKSRIIEPIIEQEREKTLREKIKEKIDVNNESIENLSALQEGMKNSPKLKDSIVRFMKKIEELKSQNVQLKAIYDIDEENFTQEIVDLANELIIDKI